MRSKLGTRCQDNAVGESIVFVTDGAGTTPSKIMDLDLYLIPCTKLT